MNFKYNLLTRRVNALSSKEHQPVLMLILAEACSNRLPIPLYVLCNQCISLDVSKPKVSWCIGSHSDQVDRIFYFGADHNENFLGDIKKLNVVF